MNDIKILSFGYLHGEPPKADITIDLRELLSDPAHRPQGDMLDMTGLDKEVEEFVFATFGAYALLHTISNTVIGLSHIKPVTLAIGCAGGRHRSVVFAEKISELINGVGWTIKPQHLHIDLPRVVRSKT